MIKFFRKIRHSLIMENKTSKYLKYAIGEIALVMIGILLALQVNNWNEQRKNNSAFEKLINSFKEEIKLNIANANNIIRINYRSDSTMQQILNPKEDMKVFIADNSLRSWIGFYTTTIRFSDENLNLLLNQKEDFPRKYESLIKDMLLLKELIESQKKWENVVMDLVNDASKYNDLNLPWFTKNDSLSNAQKRAYIFNNPYYHNRLETFAEVQLDENVYDMNNVRLVSLMLLKAIEDLQNATNHQDAEEFIRSLGFNTLPKAECNDSIVPLANKASFRMSMCVYNATKDSVTLQATNENGEKFRTELKIPPGKIAFTDRYRLEGTIFIHEKNGACVAKYQNRRNSILLIQ